MLRKFRLELARTPERPDGDAQCGYEFVAPVDPKGHFDIEVWRANREKCVVRRFWRNADDEHGHLLHTRGGRWVFSYDEDSEDDDEPIFKLGAHLLREGEYVSITEHDGIMRPFKVVSVK